MHTFLLWLQQNVVSAQSALLLALARKDDLQFVEAPKIQREYMEKIGRFEREAIAKELDAVILEKKERMIQACINRREKIDMEMIDALLNQEREALLERAGFGRVPEQHHLSSEEEEELRGLYKEIVERFHPSVHPDLNDTKKTLFSKAAEAYQHQDLTMMKLIHEMLWADITIIPLTFEVEMEIGDENENLTKAAQELAQKLTEDYTLAAELFRHFNPLQEEQILQKAAQDYIEQCNTVLKEIDSMLTNFPFSARETLADEQKTEAYLSQIQFRIAQADERIAELRDRIARKTGETANE